MPDRSYLNIYNGTSYATLMPDDQSIQGSWSNPNVPLLIFKDNSLPGNISRLSWWPREQWNSVELLSRFAARLQWRCALGSRSPLLLKIPAQELGHARLRKSLKRPGC